MDYSIQQISVYDILLFFTIEFHYICDEILQCESKSCNFLIKEKQVLMAYSTLTITYVHYKLYHQNLTKF